MINKKELIAAIKVLRKEVEILTSRLEPQDTGHLHTAINVINSRIDEMILQASNG
jgi:hypothetical protein|tara:strand:- start:6395 stop:6559 length:165 start_codon:yes stop_codon:yes gene_type:complete